MQIITDKDISSKPYSSLERTTYKNQKSYEPITFSEIRHLYRNKERFQERLYRVAFVDDKIKFTDGLKNQWFEYKKEDFLSRKLVDMDLD